MLEEVYSPTCTCLAKAREFIQDTLVRRGLRWVGYDPVVLKAFPLGALATERENLRVVIEEGSWVAVDDAGREVARNEGSVPESVMFHLSRDEARGRWVLGALVDEGPADSVIGPDWRSR